MATGNRRRATMACLALAMLLIGALGGCGARKTATASAGGPQPSPPVSATPAATATPSGVTLVVAQTPTNRYDPLRAIVVNGFATPIAVSARQSNCGLLSVERRNGGAWTQVAPCQQTTTIAQVPVNPGSSLDLTVQPGASAVAGGAWEPGAYRVALRYAGGDAGAGTTRVLYSQPFGVG